MTEKRFVLKYIDEQYISANLYDNGTFIGSISIGEELILELLNNLSKENEQLKKQIGELEFKLRTIEAYDRTVKEEHSDTVYDFKKKLEKW